MRFIVVRRDVASTYYAVEAMSESMALYKVRSVLDFDSKIGRRVVSPPTWEVIADDGKAAQVEAR